MRSLKFFNSNDCVISTHTLRKHESKNLQYLFKDYLLATSNFLLNNIFIIGNVFKLLKKYRKKFVFASSQMSNMDFSPYGTLKRLGENMTNSLKGIYVKFWNVYGIEKQLNKSHVITDFVLMALKKNRINNLQGN